MKKELIRTKKFPKTIWCPTCGEHSVDVNVVGENRAFSMCSRNEESGRDYFTLEDIESTLWK